MNPPSQTKANILNRTKEVIRRKQMSLATERAYCGWIARYFDYCLALPREMEAEAKLESFLTQLAVVHDVSASTQNGAFHAVRFLYTEVAPRPLNVDRINALRASRPQQIRHAPSVEDTIALLRDVRDVSGYPSSLVTRMLYGSGLRVCEPLNLRIKDVRIDRRELYILGAKGPNGGKDRVVRLPEAVIPEIERQMVHARTIWERDAREGMPVAMPHQLAKKYPEYRFYWQWAWLFPMHKPCRHPRTGEMVRWRMMEDIVQRAVKESRRRLCIQVVPHELRHAYATHSLDRGVNMKALQEAMGHKHIDTTAGYCHAEALSVRSPLDALPDCGGNVLPFVEPVRSEPRRLA